MYAAVTHSLTFSNLLRSPLQGQGRLQTAAGTAHVLHAWQQRCLSERTIYASPPQEHVQQPEEDAWNAPRQAAVLDCRAEAMKKGADADAGRRADVRTVEGSVAPAAEPWERREAHGQEEQKQHPACIACNGSLINRAERSAAIGSAPAQGYRRARNACIEARPVK